MSLADRILRYGVRLPTPTRRSPAYDEHTQAIEVWYNEALKEIISTGPVIHIDAAVSLWLDSAKTVPLPADLPCVAPPFPTFFLESRISKDWPFGVMVEGFSPEEYPELDEVDTFSTDLTWILQLSSVILWPGQPGPQGPQTRVTLGLGPTGQLTKLTQTGEQILGFPILPSEWSFGWWRPEVRYPGHDESISRLVETGSLRVKDGMVSVDPEAVVRWDQECHVWPSLFAISLMHCKNVQLVNGRRCTPTAGAYGRRKKKPVVFKVLDIEPMRKVLRHEGGMASGNSLKRAIHICRGHFKDYRDHGLFGKMKGIYWWDMHVRGSADAGVVVKEYRIKQSKQEVSKPI